RPVLPSGGRAVRRAAVVIGFPCGGPIRTLVLRSNRVGHDRNLLCGFENRAAGSRAGCAVSCGRSAPGPARGFLGPMAGMASRLETPLGSDGRGVRSARRNLMRLSRTGHLEAASHHMRRWAAAPLGFGVVVAIMFSAGAVVWGQVTGGL